LGKNLKNIFRNEIFSFYIYRLLYPSDQDSEYIRQQADCAENEHLFLLIVFFSDSIADTKKKIRNIRISYHKKDISFKKKNTYNYLYVQNK